MVLLSTREVATLLKVSEATVKRWSDAGMIACVRTPGGHRKFRQADVHAFVGSAEQEVQSTPSVPAPSAPLSEYPETLFLSGDVRGTAALLQGPGLDAESLAATCDRVLAPSLVEIGRKWSTGEINAAEEHVAANTVLEAVAQTLARIPTPSAEAPAALFACVGSEEHDIGLRMARIVIQSAGFATLLLGGTVPVLDLVTLMNRTKPVLVALSASDAADRNELRGQLGVLSSAARTLGVKLVIGGAGFSKVDVLPSGVDRFTSLADFATFARATLRARTP